MAVSAATVIRLRSRLDSPGRSQTSPNRTFSLRSMSFGATGRTTSRAVTGAGCVLTVCSFLCGGNEPRRDSTRFARLTPATLAASIPTARPDRSGGLHAPTPRHDLDKRRRGAVTARWLRARPRGPRRRREGDGRGYREVDPVLRQRRELPGRAELHARSAVAALRRQELHAHGELRDRRHPRPARADARREPAARPHELVAD